MNQALPVLIVGAGPTGLMLANLFALQNIEFRIIDQKSTTTETSNALAIHARNLEMLDRFKMLKPFTQRSQLAKRVVFNSEKKKIAEIDFAYIDSKFKCAYLLPQNLTERFLIKHLETQLHHVEFGATLTELKLDETTVTATIDSPKGEEKITCAYVVACDGAHSTARHLLNIDFPGDTLPEHFLLADIHTKSSHPTDEINLYSSPHGLLGIFALQPQILRITANIHPSMVPNDKKHFKQALVNMLNSRGHGNIQLDGVIWSSQFSVNTRAIRQLQHGRVFFAGDAAHVHSPAGGQGMNTGMQDAFNLAWKLAMVIKKQAKNCILASYSQERLPIIRGILKMSKALTKQNLTHNPIKRKLQQTALKLLTKKSSFQRKAVNQISQIGLHYTHSNIIEYRSNFISPALKPGYFFHDVEYINEVGERQYFKTHLRELNFYLLIFCSTELSEVNEGAIEETLETFHQRYKNVIKPMVITTQSSCHKFKTFPITKVVDAKLILHNTYQITQPSLVLVRPDHYIAYSTNKIDSGKLVGFVINSVNGG